MFSDFLQAENVVLTLRDLFQVVFEMKKKESEDEKKLKLDNRENTKTEEKTSVSSCDNLIKTVH